MLISNPLNSELATPLAIAFASLLSMGLLGVIFAVLLSSDKSLNSQLWKRWGSWALIAPITVTAILSGPIVFAFLAAIVSVICTMEFCTITKRNPAERLVLALVSAALPIVACCAEQVIAPTFLVTALLLCFLSMKDGKDFQSTCLSIMALIYVPFLASHAVFLDKVQGIGPQLLISVVTSSALANIFAFVFGKLIGGPKLAATISPNKTWSGVTGSLVGAYVGFALLSSTLNLSLGVALTILIPLVVSIAGVLGDLFESQLKRSFEVKDAGTWLPGFGGALDRVDGLLFILPCVYYLVSQVI